MMNLQERIANLEGQLKEWQTRRQTASDALSEAQSAILQLQGALAFARSLTDETDPQLDAVQGDA